MALTNKQKEEIAKIIKDALTTKLKTYELVGDVKPFHERLFSKKRIRETSFFHSCSTTIGVTLFQNIAYLIAKGNKNFKEVKKPYDVEGTFSSNAQSIIENIIFDLGRRQNDPKKRTPNIEDETRAVLKVASESGNTSAQRADLYLKDKNDQEIYIEIKSVKPNKSESKETKRGMLKIIALKRKKVKVLACMAYNPYEPKEFAWPLPLSYMKLKEDLLVGKQFWDMLGGSDTYEDLLDVFEESGKKLSKDLEAKINELEKL
ncbi:TPA: TdeIII family type II restriction endonuclease [archaeon]|nr:TdeIII family type II restriction endonuclease [Candidatus Naiadarchaeales archaeon SRR2090159.bin1288]